MRCAQAAGTTTQTCEGDRPGNQIVRCRAAAVNPDNGVVICYASYSRPGAHMVRAGHSGERDLDDSRSKSITERVAPAASLSGKSAFKHCTLRLWVSCAAGSCGCMMRARLGRRRQRLAQLDTTLAAGLTRTIAIKLPASIGESLATHHQRGHHADGSAHCHRQETIIANHSLTP
jgi:hypothetical protein